MQTWEIKGNMREQYLKLFYDACFEDEAILSG